MYIIKRNGRRYGKKEFFTYEDARSYARKRIRMEGVSGWDRNNNVHRNPSLRLNGFKVVYIPYSFDFVPW